MAKRKNKDNPKEPTVFERLMAAKLDSWRKLEAFRENRMNALRQFVGSRYGPTDMGSQSRIPVNFLELAVNVYLRQLASSPPAITWTTQRPALKPQALAAELMHNHVLKEIQFKQTLRVWVLEGLFCHGVTKVGITNRALHEAFGPLHDAGQPFVDVVFGDDWVHDVTAKVYEQANFVGNRYWLTVDEADAAFKLTKSERTALKSLGSEQFSNTDTDPAQRSHSLSGGQDVVSLDPFLPRVELWDLWLPHINAIVTVSNFLPKKALHIIDWDGPEVGPYHRIIFEDVPGNIMPLPPVSIMMDLHLVANNLYRKMTSQAQRQKHNWAYTGAATKDAETHKAAADGEYVQMNTPEAVVGLTTPGPDPGNLAFFLQTKDLYAWLLGNLDSLGGLSPQADTLGQEQLLTAGASRRLDDMRDRITDAVQGVQESLGDYIWNDPSLEKTFTKHIGGPGASGIDVPILFKSDLKEGDPLDFNVEILPNSMQQLTPAERLRTVTQFIERFAIPLAPLMEQQGIQVDLKELADIVARFSGVGELRDIVKTGAPPPPLVGGKPERPRQSPVTTRNTVRHNIPGASRSGKDNVLTRILSSAGSGVQKSEAATLTRPTG